jgi:hypothetical protein
VYQIQLEDNVIDPIFQSILPQEAEMYFSGNRTVLNFASKGNLFRLSLISDNEKKLIIQQLKMMKKKVKAVLNDRDVFYYQDNRSHTILRTQHKDTVAGIPSSVSILVFDDLDTPEYKVIHTDKIEISNPNWYNLYREIPEVLLEYEFVLFGFNVKLRAKNVEYFEVSPSHFEADLEYQNITPEQLMEELKKISDTL